MKYLILFLIFALGGCAGMIVLALCFVSKRADDAVNNDIPPRKRAPR